MKYLVMECHTAYAVVLDENGRFLKVANQNYQVGQRVSEIIEMQLPQKSRTRFTAGTKWASAAAALAACLILVMSGLFHVAQTPYASVYMTINPQVRLDVNRQNTVIAAAGLNEDGKQLLEGYDYKRKALDPVMDELVDRAISQGYLSAGSTITLNLDGSDSSWVTATEQELNQHLTEYLTDKISVVIQFESTSGIRTDIAIPSATASAAANNIEGGRYSNSDYQAPAAVTAPPRQQQPASSRPPAENMPAATYTPAPSGSNYEEPAASGAIPSYYNVTDYNPPVYEADSDYTPPAEEGRSNYELSDDDVYEDVDDD